MISTNVRIPDDVDYCQSRRLELTVVVLAAVLRLAWAIAVPVVPMSDSGAYDIFARNMAIGENFGWEPNHPTAWWSVGPSFVYSISYRLFGVHYLPIVIFQVVVSTATVWLAMILARRWFGTRVGIVTGFLFAIWPSQVQFVTVLASEAYFSFFLVSACLVWFVGRQQWTVRAVATGVLLGLGCYMRPTGLLLPFLFGGLEVVRGSNLRQTIAGTIIMGTIVVAIAAPWMVRNERAFGRPTGLTSNFGLNFWQGNNPETRGEYMRVPAEMRALGLNEAQLSDHLMKIAVQYCRDEPVKFATRTVSKFLRQHSRETIGVGWNAKGLGQRISPFAVNLLKAQSLAYWIIMLSLSMGGIVLLGSRYGILHLLTHPALVIWGYFATTHAVILIQDRYSFQSIPFIAMFASLTLVAAWDRYKPAVVQS